MHCLTVGLGERSYDIAIGAGALDDAGTHLAPFCPNGRAIIVTDENVARHWLAPLAASLASAGIAAEPIVLPPGEATKSWDQLERLVETLLDLGITRDEPVIALGGGVVGDIAGFAAAIVKRGCRLVQIPTSLLAQVDGAVGGKTAINGRTGKNLVGAFHQPGFVLVDPATLATLPDRELRAGYAETVKYGLIADAGFFAWCEANADRLLDREMDALTEAIAHCLAAKARIVGEDETDRTGRRALLNLGHTFAHALEAEAGFSDRLLHGEAVAIGTALAFGFAARTGLCAQEDADRVVAHLEAAGLPVRPRDAGIDASGESLVARMRQDKKAEGGRLRLVLPRRIGAAFVAEDVDGAELARFLEGER